MKTRRTTARDVDEYIAGFPEDVQKILEKLRKTIHQAAPGASEKISYQIPTFTLEGTYLVYFAAFKNHISVYPAIAVDEEFEKELSVYRSGKGTLKFPLGKSIPFDLVTRFVKYRAKQNSERAAAKAQKKTGQK